MVRLPHTHGFLPRILAALATKQPSKIIPNMMGSNPILNTIIISPGKFSDNNFHIVNAEQDRSR
jgi:hypothetical protein